MEGTSATLVYDPPCTWCGVGGVPEAPKLTPRPTGGGDGGGEGTDRVGHHPGTKVSSKCRISVTRSSLPSEPTLHRPGFLVQTPRTGRSGPGTGGRVWESFRSDSG